MPGMNRGLALLLMASSLIWSECASAQAVMEGTRVVLPAADREVAIRLSNPGDRPTLTYAWIDEGDAQQLPTTSRAPFVIAPPVIRIEPGRNAVLRIRVAGKAPEDGQEHLYWLNLQDVPAKETAKEGEAQLSVAVRGRYKLFYRPAGMRAPADPEQQVTIGMQADGEGRFVQLSNRSAYFFNLGRVLLVHATGETEIENPYVPPHGSVRIAIPPELKDDISGVRFWWIDDMGALHETLRRL